MSMYDGENDLVERENAGAGRIKGHSFDRNRKMLILTEYYSA